MSGPASGFQLQVFAPGVTPGGPARVMRVKEFPCIRMLVIIAALGRLLASHGICGLRFPAYGACVAVAEWVFREPPDSDSAKAGQPGLFTGPVASPIERPLRYPVYHSTIHCGAVFGSAGRYADA